MVIVTFWIYEKEHTDIFFHKEIRKSRTNLTDFHLIHVLQSELR